MKISAKTTRRLIAGATTALAALAITSAAGASTSSHAASRTIPKCTASQLGVWVAANQGNGTAGSIFYPMEFTNLSGSTCYMYGYPGVSAVNGQGKQLGSAAGRNSAAKPSIVNLAPGGTAHSLLQYVVVQVSPQCKQTPAAELKVYPPDQTSATDAFWSLESCSTSGTVYLNVGVIQPGVGSISSQ